MSDEFMTIYAIMPKEIYKTKELSLGDKLIAERLVYLCKKEGYSWITNSKLAEIYGIKEDTVSQHIMNLRKYGFIKCIYDKMHPNKSNRTIYLTEALWDKKPSEDRLDNQNTIGSKQGYNNNNYKDNNKIIEPSWLNQDIKAQEWDMNNPEDVKAKQELEDILAEFRGDDDE